MHISPPLSPSQLVDIEPAMYELLTLRSAYDSLRRDYASLDATLQETTQELHTLRARHTAELQQAKQAHAAEAQSKIDLALAESAEQLAVEREASARALELNIVGKKTEANTLFQLQALRQDYETQQAKSSDEIRGLKAEIESILKKKGPGLACQALGGRTVDELAEGLLRAFAGPKSQMVARDRARIKTVQ